MFSQNVGVLCQTPSKLVFEIRYKQAKFSVTNIA
jgi:hypothetical protein